MIEAFPLALARLARLLGALGRPAALIGGVAITARVRARATRDVDALIALGRADVDRLLEQATAAGYAFDPSDRLLFEEGLARLWPAADGPGGVGLDLIFADSPYLERVIARATPVDLGGVTLPVATVEDLVLLKLEAARPGDVDDVLAIKDALAGTLDLAYLREEARQLGIRGKLDLYLGD